MTDAADRIARQLADLGFCVSITLAYAWAFRASDDEGDGVRQMLGMAEEAAWDGDHPRELTGTAELPDGYSIDVFAFDPKTIEDVGFAGVRPDETEVALTLDEVVELCERYGLATKTGDAA